MTDAVTRQLVDRITAAVDEVDRLHRRLAAIEKASHLHRHSRGPANRR